MGCQWVAGRWKKWHWPNTEGTCIPAGRSMCVCAYVCGMEGCMCIRVHAPGMHCTCVCVYVCMRGCEVSCGVSCRVKWYCTIGRSWQSHTSSGSTSSAAADAIAAWLVFARAHCLFPCAASARLELPRQPASGRQPTCRTGTGNPAAATAALTLKQRGYRTTSQWCHWRDRPVQCNIRCGQVRRWTWLAGDWGLLGSDSVYSGG